jgi:prevent-host-death family protein
MTVHVSVTDAKAQLTDLVRRAEAGDDIVLTRHGQDAVRLVPVKPMQTAEDRRAFLERFRKDCAGKITDGPDAAHSQDFLYDEYGLPK